MCPRRKRSRSIFDRFKATYKGRPLFACATGRSGIEHASELEFVLARVWAGESRASWDVLSGDEQSEIIAAYKTQAQEQAVVEWANRPKPMTGMGRGRGRRR